MSDENSVEIGDDKFLKITYGFLASSFVVLIGFAAWMTSVELNANNLDKDVKHIQQQQDEVELVLQSIDKRLYRIELLLERLSKEK